MRKASQCTALWRCKGLKCLFAGLYFFQYIINLRENPGQAFLLVNYYEVIQ